MTTRLLQTSAERMPVGQARNGAAIVDGKVGSVASKCRSLTTQIRSGTFFCPEPCGPDEVAA